MSLLVIAGVTLVDLHQIPRFATAPAMACHAPRRLLRLLLACALAVLDHHLITSIIIATGGGGGRVAAQLSRPITSDTHVTAGAADNKFLNRRAVHDEQSDEDDIHHDYCSHGVNLKWAAEVESSLYATPLITDLFSDGKLDIIAPSYVHYLEALDAATGSRIPGWPSFHQSNSHASPLLYDADNDGIEDILIATYDGQILFFKDTGEPMSIKDMKVPPLPVRRQWYVGLAPDHVDHSHHDVQDEPSFNDAEFFLPEEKYEEEDADLLDSDDDVDNVIQGRRRILSEMQDSEESFEDDQVIGVERGNEELPKEAFQTFDILERANEDYAYDGYPRDAAWKAFDGSYANYHNVSEAEENIEWIDVDPHILCTPVIADLDNDTRMELIVSVSYFFDRQQYDDTFLREDLRKRSGGIELDLAKYIAGGIVVFDLVTMRYLWHTHLDLTTDHTRFRAYIYSSPTVADLNNDGYYEILVGTSVGFLYALSHTGESLKGFPLQMADIQGQLKRHEWRPTAQYHRPSFSCASSLWHNGQVVVGDINDDGELEIVAADSHGNLAAFTASGQEIWDRHLGSSVSQVSTLGDVDGDGALEIVVGTNRGALHVVRGETGEDVPGFPFFTYGKLMAPISITKLNDKSPGLQLIVMSFDGFLYIVDGYNGCVETSDVGEVAYAMPLVEDLDGDGKLELLISTMNGNLFVYETGASFHPLKTWPSQVLSRNGFTARWEYQGIAILPHSRGFRDVGGGAMQIQFEIVDRRPRMNSSESRKYSVDLYMYTESFGAMGLTTQYDEPGVHTLAIAIPTTRAAARLVLEMRDETGSLFSDCFAVTFHVRIFRLLKWVMLLPFSAMVGLLLMTVGSSAINDLPLQAAARR